MQTLSSRFYTIFSAGWRQRYVILFPMLILPIVGGYIGLNTYKKYTAHTSILIQETSKLNPFLEDFAVSAMLKERMAALDTLLHSRHILGAVASDLELIDEKSTDFEKQEKISLISEGLALSSAGKDLIRIDYTSGSPDTVKVTLEAVSKHFIEQLLAPERSSMKDSSSFLYEHLQERRLELDAAEKLLADYKDQNSSELPELYTSNISQLTKLESLLSSKLAELSGIKKSMGGISAQLSKTNPVILKIEEQIVREKSDLALLRAKYTEGHSKVQAGIRKIKQLEMERQNALAKTKGHEEKNLQELWHSAVNVETSANDKTQPLLISQLERLQEKTNRVNSLQEEVKSLKTMISELKVKTQGNGSREKELNLLERDLMIKKKLYNQILERFEMARVTGSLGDFEKEKRIKVIDEPYTPNAPSNLPAFIFVIGGLFGGLFLGVGLAIMNELLDNSIRSRKRIEELTNITVVCRIPNINKV